MILRLDVSEVDVLSRVLKSYLSDLRMEISHTENYDMRQEMKVDEEVIKKLISHLDEAKVESA